MIHQSSDGAEEDGETLGVEEAEDGLAAALVAEEPRVDLLLAHLHDVVEAVEVEGLEGRLGGMFV